MMKYPINAAIRAEVFSDLQASFSDLDNPDGPAETPLTVETLVTRLFECEMKARLELQQIEPTDTERR